jgi:hypothetical protein
MLKIIIVLALGLGACATAAQASEMSASDIRTLVSGNTAYLALNPGAAAGTGDGVIYYSADGTATFKTPSGAIWHGPWILKDNTLCIDWKEQPNNPCTRYEKEGSDIVLINVATGKPRGKVVKVAPGNPEKL